MACRGGGGNGATARASKVGSIKRVKLQKLQKLHFIKLLKIYAFPYRKSTDTRCMDMIGSCLGAWCDYVS